jgi:hypothetical protein
MWMRGWLRSERGLVALLGMERVKANGAIADLTRYLLTLGNPLNLAFKALVVALVPALKNAL